MKEEEKQVASNPSGEAAHNPSDNTKSGKELVHSIDSKSNGMKRKTIFLFSAVAITGVLSGLLVAFITKPTSEKLESSEASKTVVEAAEEGKIVGSEDEKSFSDSAEGTLREGGIDGEGTHHLERPGGESQNVYLTSSVIDLSAFVDKKVTVWGETFAAQKAGWLMDVGRLQLQD